MEKRDACEWMRWYKKKIFRTKNGGYLTEKWLWIYSCRSIQSHDTIIISVSDMRFLMLKHSKNFQTFYSNRLRILFSAQGIDPSWSNFLLFWKMYFPQGKMSEKSRLILFDFLILEAKWRRNNTVSEFLFNGKNQGILKSVWDIPLLCLTKK